MFALQGKWENAIKLISDCIKEDSSQPSYFYNRAVMFFAIQAYEKAVTDIEKAENLHRPEVGEINAALDEQTIKQKEKKLRFLLALVDDKIQSEDYSEALSYLDAAQKLRPQEPATMFRKAELGLLQKNPFTSLDAIKSLRLDRLGEEERLEVVLMKAYNLGRINKVYEAIDLLEKLVHDEQVSDPRPRQLLSYYYLKLKAYQKSIDILKGQVYQDANTYVIAGNAGLFQRSFNLALRCFQKARFLDSKDINAQIGIALCLTNKSKQSRAIELIDSLAVAHPTNHYVWNTKGIIYKDVGLDYKNGFHKTKALPYFIGAAAAFDKAKELNKHLQASFDNNRALALFFQDKEKEATEIWLTNKQLASQNNLALAKVKAKDYSMAYHKLDSLQKAYYALHHRKNKVLKYNKTLAKSRTKLNNNYRFVTNYFLTQQPPLLNVSNPFELSTAMEKQVSDFDYILDYSDANCKEELERKKKKKTRKFKLFNRKKKKYEGDCPSF